MSIVLIKIPQFSLLSRWRKASSWIGWYASGEFYVYKIVKCPDDGTYPLYRFDKKTCVKEWFGDYDTVQEAKKKAEEYYRKQII